jgi:putative membrane protein
MKKLSYVFMIALAAYALQGCHSASKSASSNADSLTQATDTTAAAKTGSVKVDSADASFAMNASGGNLAEIAIAKLALQKTTNPQIKEFANMMITDHGSANAALAAIAKTKNLTLPAAVSADVQKDIDNLSKKSGKAFDKAYVDAMYDGHKQALAMFKNAETMCADPDLKAFATKTEPVIQKHFDAISKIKADMK